MFIINHAQYHRKRANVARNPIVTHPKAAPGVQRCENAHICRASHKFWCWFPCCRLWEAHRDWEHHVARSIDSVGTDGEGSKLPTSTCVQCSTFFNKTRLEFRFGVSHSPKQHTSTFLRESHLLLSCRVHLCISCRAFHLYVLCKQSPVRSGESPMQAS